MRFIARDETDRALRDLVGYRVYRDLERGWRVTAPNLEQTGLLEIRYAALDDLVAAEDVWAPLHVLWSQPTTASDAAPRTFFWTLCAGALRSRSSTSYELAEQLRLAQRNTSSRRGLSKMKSG